MKILCTGDVHIGRRSSKLPSGLEARTHSSAEAWSRLIDLALAERVDVVAVTGDLVDEANRFFEAFGPVERGLRRLTEAGIVVVLVAGNHDHEVLPRIVDEVRLEGVRLLGRGGCWERLTIDRGGERLHVDGWSFPSARHLASPLAEYVPAPDGAPILAVVHGDLDQPRSPYGPLTTPDLRRFPHTFFALGHVHTPRVVNEPGGARALYPGSPQALDPGEPGPHGVFLLHVGPEGIESTLVPVSTVRYERLEVSVATLERVEDVERAIAGALRAALTEHPGGGRHLRHLRCRVVLTGSVPYHRSLDERFRERVRELEIDGGSAVATVERVEVDTRPLRDLAALSELHGAPGVLARLLTRLESGQLTPADEQLLRSGLRAMRDVRGAPQYLEVIEHGPAELVEEAEVRREIDRGATLLLDELLGQREVRG
ncbi:MAG TPA: DNA repair exonuclease [Longimicrobiaceae bacterium]|nr:DNA repair exonuclease [Longimicrobiaceae bacterium]